MTHMSRDHDIWPPLITELQELQLLFDGEIRGWVDAYEAGGGRIFCGKGCRGCCSLAVNASFTEAVAVAGVLNEALARRVRGHAAVLREKCRTISDLRSYLRMHREQTDGCPFLDEEGSCGIYAVRPFSCRSLLATRESRYCSLDFAKLTAEEKAAFIAGLDLTAVSFPMHYLAASQVRGQELESRAARGMADRFGFSLYGSLPILVFLEREHGLSRIAAQGYEPVMALLEKTGLDSPFLVMVDQGRAAMIAP